MVSCLWEPSGACPLGSPQSLSFVQLGAEPLRGSQQNPHSLAPMLPTRHGDSMTAGQLLWGCHTQAATTVLQANKTLQHLGNVLSPSAVRSRWRPAGPSTQDLCPHRLLDTGQVAFLVGVKTVLTGQSGRHQTRLAAQLPQALPW